MNNSTLLGSCLCGKIGFEVTQLENKMGHCHCTMCRKFHGAAFTTFGEAKTENFKWLRGEDLLKGFIAPNGTERQFCENCGSSLLFKSAKDNGDCVEFALGALDTPIDQRPDVHIYTRYKADWYTITDKLPQYEESREETA